MKILHVGIAYYPATAFGGPVRSLMNMCHGLTELGHSCDVCVTDCDGVRNIEVPLSEPVEREECTVRYFHSPRWLFYGYSPDMKKWLQASVANYDIVHISGIWNFPERYAAAACRKHNVPYIISPRGSADIRLVKERLALAKWLYVLAFDKRNLAAANAIHYTTPAEEERSILKKVNKSHFIVPNAVDMETIGEYDANQVSPAIRDLAKNRYILFLGRITWKKQVHVLVEAFETMARKHPELHLVVGGPDDEGLGRRAFEGVKDESLKHRIHFIGVVEGNDIKALYANAELFVLPSLSENFGHSVIEALSTKIPVVSSPYVDATVFKEVRNLCAMCEPTVDGLADKLAEVIDHYGQWKKLVERGPLVAQTLFDSAKTAADLSGNYEYAIRSKRA